MQFDDQFFNAMGLEGASEEQKLELAVQVAEAVQNGVAMRLSELLTGEQMEEFSRLSEGSDEAAYEYLQQVYPDYDLLVQDELETVKAQLMQDAASLKQILDDENKA
jgi:hypothetical protein